MHMKIPSTLIIATAGWSNRIISAIVQIVSIPLFIKLLGLSGYAAFSVVSGFVCWFALAEFGIGSVLQNDIAYHRVNNISLDGVIEKYVSLLIIVTFFCILCYIPISVILNHLLINTFSQYNHLLLVAGIIYMIFINSNVIYKIFFAFHQGYIGYVAQSVGNIIWFIIILVFSFWHKLNVSPTFILALTLCPQIFISMLILQRFRLNWSIINVLPNKARREEYRCILNQSMRFFWVTLTSNFVIGIDYFFIARLLGQHEIITYNIINKVYVFIAFGYNVFLAVLWPILGELYSRGRKEDYLKANMLLVKCICSAVMYVIFTSALLIVLRGVILMILTKSSIQIPIKLVGLFCLYYCIRVFVDFICVALQSRSQVKILMLTAPLQAVITVILMIALVKKYALFGVMCALIGGFILTAGWMLPTAYIRRNNKQQADWGMS